MKMCKCTNLCTAELMDDFQGILTCRDCGKKHYPSKPKEVTKDLYNPKDVKETREILATEQDNLDSITGIPLSQGRAVLDHAHDDEQLVRGVLLHEVNSFVGKLENAHKRHINYWLKDRTLAQLLRQVANYLEKPKDLRYRHNGWIKKINTWFNALSESQKKFVLRELGQPEGSNVKERKALFQKSLLTKQFSFDTIRTIINTAKGEQ